MSKYQRWDKQNTNYDLSQTYQKNKVTSNCSNNALRKKIDQNLAALINHQKNQKYTLGDTSNRESDDNPYNERYERYDRSPIKRQRQFVSRQHQFKDKYAKEDSYQNKYTREDSYQNEYQARPANNYKAISQAQPYSKNSNESQIYNRELFTKNSFMNQNFCQQKQKIDQNCSRTDNSIIQKRQNARKKGFDIRVNNIECINDRISNLLDMVKKDKRAVEKEPQPDKYTPPKIQISNEKNKKYGYSSPHNIAERKKENQTSHHYLQSNYHYSAKRELKANRQNQEKTPQKKKSYSIIQNKKHQSKSNNKMSFMNGQENNENDRNKSKLDYEQQYNKIYKGIDTQYSKKYDRYSLYAKQDRIIEDKSNHINLDEDPTKNYKYSDNYQKSVLKNKQIDRMLEQKRKQREKVKENILKESHKKVQLTRQEQQRQKLKEKQREKQKQREIEMEKGRQIQRQRQRQRQRQIQRQRERQRQRQRERQRERESEKQKLYRKKDSPILQNQLSQQYETKKAKILSPIRQFQSEKFSQATNNRVNLLPITLSSKQQRKIQDQKNQKANKSSKIFDQQINRIKSKLQQSDQPRQRSAVKYHQNREDNENTGKLYNKGSNKFELKVYPVQNTKQCTVKIAQKLSELVSIDGRCRTYRQSFQKYDNSQKWKELQKQLQKQGITIGLKDLEDIIKITPDEHNPFGNQKSSHLLNCTRDLASIFAQATKYWQQEIDKCVDLSTLKKQQFDVKDMDLNKKGYLSIQDFVCFINLYTGHFYRNRDICLVYKRFCRLDESRKTGIAYNKFLQKIAK